MLDTEERKRKMIIGLYPLNRYTEIFLLEGEIYIQLSLKEGEIKAYAYSPILFETPNEPNTNPQNSHYVYEDSNFINGRKTMPYDDFIEILARLNNIDEINDDTIEQGSSAIEKIIEEGL